MARVKVADTDELLPDTAKAIAINGKKIALFHLQEGFYAIEDACPHRGAPLSDGMIEAYFVVCPWHAARFNVKTGEASGPPAPCGVTTYPVAIENEGVYLELP